MQDNVTQAIDWNAPLEAYHPDGRVVPVRRTPSFSYEEHGAYGIDDYTDSIGILNCFQADGTHRHTSQPWRIRNRLASTAQPEVKGLVEAVREVKRELAALISAECLKGGGPQVPSDWPLSNEADAECLQSAWDALDHALAAYREAQP